MTSTPTHIAVLGGGLAGMSAAVVLASRGYRVTLIEKRAELGGPALKVVYHAGDSFGDRQARISNWKDFISLEFDALNPAGENVGVTLTVKHRRSTSYQTRVDVPITLKPGKNSVRIGIDEMLNVNGSTPDLTGNQVCGAVTEG